jgi:hypothetical protein
MAVLFDSMAHAPLKAVDWDPARARRTIARIVEETEAARRAAGFWPIHPDELDEPPAGGVGHHGVYFGAAGVVGALRLLAEAGMAEVGLDLAALMDDVEASYLRQPTETPAPEPSYFIGETGIRLTGFRVDPTPERAERLLALIASNVDAPQREFLWGAPGTLVAASFMRAWTGDPRFDAVARASVDALWSSWVPDPATGLHLWTQDLYGRSRRYLGAGHGFAGNVRALLAARDLLGPDREAELVARCEAVLDRQAVAVAGFANWPTTADAGPDAPPPSLQWCHGAPGVVTSLAPIPAGRSARLDALLLQAGELTWRAGPLKKGVGLCHGTSGNGHAFLALHRRTGDEAWLARARWFAMAAIAQHEAREGGPWSSLWTGDLGLATYLAACLAGEGGLPGVDVY